MYPVVIFFPSIGRDEVDYFFAGMEIQNGLMIQLRFTPHKGSAHRGPKDWAEAQVYALWCLRIKAEVGIPFEG